MADKTERFRKAAKRLLRAYLAGEPVAVERCAWRVAHVTLMTAQATIAREVGFRTWNELIEAPENVLRAVVLVGMEAEKK